MATLSPLTRLAVVTLAATMLAFGCSDDDSTSGGSAKPNPPAPTSASPAYTKKCGGCHGPKGTSEIRVDKDAGLRPLIPPVIPGKLSLSTYTLVVREGRPPEMPAYGAAEISDADLAADYAWMRGSP